DKIISAGHKAPTGCNYQPQRILVLNTDESVQKLKQCTKCHFDAPCAMLVCHNKDESWTRKYDGALSSPVDAVIVSTHMMLSAHDNGVGCCWVMHFDPFAMKTTFNLPDNVEPVALLVMGIHQTNLNHLVCILSRALLKTLFFMTNFDLEQKIKARQKPCFLFYTIAPFGFHHFLK
ncbi:MAG: nitroreductase family protein, partial [Clostridia bacterium]|nr:nitroreductase family protein [Clostridia bacterium]